MESSAPACPSSPDVIQGPRYAPGKIRTCDLCLRRAFRPKRLLTTPDTEAALLHGFRAIRGPKLALLHEAVSARLGHVWGTPARPRKLLLPAFFQPAARAARRDLPLGAHRLFGAYRGSAHVPPPAYAHQRSRRVRRSSTPNERLVRPSVRRSLVHSAYGETLIGIGDAPDAQRQTTWEGWLL
jgi:hypothetical protein